MAQTQFFTNQFGQQIAVGDYDLNINASGSLVGIVSPNQATNILAGAPIKIDGTITTGYVVNFLQAAITDVSIGNAKRTTMQSSFAAGDVLEVMVNAGPVIWLLAAATITPGSLVYQDTNGNVVNTGGGAKTRGIALDYATTGNPLRVLLVAAVGISA